MEMEDQSDPSADTRPWRESIGIRFVRDHESLPKRTVICDDAIKWLRSIQDKSLAGNVFTSIPDVSELNFLAEFVPENPYFPRQFESKALYREGVEEGMVNREKGGGTETSIEDAETHRGPEFVEALKQKKITKGKPDKLGKRYHLYKEWFIEVTELILRKVPHDGFAIFYQSDIRSIDHHSNILEWVDKSHLCHVAAERVGMVLKWHKMASLTEHPFEKRSVGRPSYSHLLCFARKEVTYRSALHAVPDFFYRGEMLWPKAIGLNAAMLGTSFLVMVKESSTSSSAHHRVVVDPFCGFGTILAMANAMGLESIGVDISEKRCRKARNLCLEEYFMQVPKGLKSILGVISPVQCSSDALISEEGKESDEEEVEEEEEEDT